MTSPLTEHDVDWSATPTAKIVATLKALVPLVSPNRNMELIAEAASRLDAQEAQLAEARAALKPFSGYVDKRSCTITMIWRDGEYQSTYTGTLKPDDFFAAHAALKGSQQ